MVSRTINEAKRMVFNSKMNEMVLYINMFGACMIATIFHKHDGRLAVQVESDQVSKQLEHFSNELSKP